MSTSTGRPPVIFICRERATREVAVFVCTRVEPLRLVDTVRKTVAGIDPDQAVANFRSREQLVSHSIQQRRLALVLLGVFSVVAVGLACLGIHGVLAYAIGLRQREFGVRIALGATLSDLVMQVVGDGMRVVLLAVGVGLVAALIAGRLIVSLLYEVIRFCPPLLWTCERQLIW